MGTTEMEPARLICSIGKCGMKFASQRELKNHEDGLHGELKHPLQAGSRSTAASSSDEVKTSAMKQRTKNGVPSTHSEVRIPSLVDHQQEDVIEGSAVTSDSPNQDLNGSSLLNSSLRPQTTTPTSAGQVGSTTNPSNLQEAVSVQPRTFEYSPLPRGSVPRSFEGSSFGGRRGKPVFRGGQ